jgi:hypothetical protein
MPTPRGHGCARTSGSPLGGASRWRWPSPPSPEQLQGRAHPGARAPRSPEDAVRGGPSCCWASELKQRRPPPRSPPSVRGAALDSAMRFRALAGTGLAHEEQRRYGPPRSSRGVRPEPGQAATRGLGEGAARRRPRRPVPTPPAEKATPAAPEKAAPRGAGRHSDQPRASWPRCSPCWAHRARRDHPHLPLPTWARWPRPSRARQAAGTAAGALPPTCGHARAAAGPAGGAPGRRRWLRCPAALPGL